MGKTNTTRYVRLDEYELEWLRGAIERDGERNVAKAAGLSTFTIVRMAGGLRVLSMSAKLFRQHLAEHQSATVHT